jgi:serine/threonine-protein kinase PknK
MPMRVRVLLGLIVAASVVGLVVWLVRYQPFGPVGPIGSFLPSGHPSAAGWQAGPDAPFARLEMAAAVFDDRIWLAGGLEPDTGATDALSILDPATGAWDEGAPLPEAVHHAALAADGDRLYLIGGYLGSSGAATDAVHVLDPADGTWEPGPPLPEPRGAGAAVHDGERIVYAGGVDPDGVADDVFVLVDGEWSRIGALARPREHLAAATDGAGRTWFLGGRQGGLDTNVGDVDLVDGNDIRFVATLTPRGGVAAFFAQGIGACLTGGEAPSFALATVECADETGAVTALPSMNQRRHGHAVAVIGGEVRALLGGEVPGLSASATTESLRLDD